MRGRQRDAAAAHERMASVGVPQIVAAADAMIAALAGGAIAFARLLDDLKPLR